MRSSLLLIFAVVASSFAADGVLADVSCTGRQIFAERRCDGDAVTADETALYQLINKYRAANKRPAIPLSSSLSTLANRRMLDLKLNMRVLTHSWSDCTYSISDQKTWPCVMDAPRRLNIGYTGQGFETLYRSASGKVLPTAAVDAWAKSSLHSSIILNAGDFKDLDWDEVGVAIDGQYAALWFGHPGIGTRRPGREAAGLGVSYEETVAGLTKIFSIDEKSTTVIASRWQGKSRNGKAVIELHGTPKEISEAELDLTLKLEPNRRMDADSRQIVATLLKSIFPEWSDVETWVATSADAIAIDRSVMKMKTVRKIDVTVRSDGRDSLKFSIRPQSKAGYKLIN